jgi:hypothetical protein
MTVLTERVRELRPVFLPRHPASRTGYVAGEIAQHDFWFPVSSCRWGSGRPAPGLRRVRASTSSSPPKAAGRVETVRDHGGGGQRKSSRQQFNRRPHGWRPAYYGGSQVEGS